MYGGQSLTTLKNKLVNQTKEKFEKEYKRQPEPEELEMIEQQIAEHFNLRSGGYPNLTIDGQREQKLPTSACVNAITKSNMAIEVPTSSKSTDLTMASASDASKATDVEQTAPKRVLRIGMRRK